MENKFLPVESKQRPLELVFENSKVVAENWSLYPLLIVILYPNLNLGILTCSLFSETAGSLDSLTYKKKRRPLAGYSVLVISECEFLKIRRPRFSLNYLTHG